MSFKIWKVPGFGWTNIFNSDNWRKIGEGFDNLGDWLSNKWDDYTGLNLAKYQQQMQEEMYEKYQSPSAIMRQYKEAGLNPNLIYGSASAGIGHAPSFDASPVMRGSEKVNSALSMLSQLLGLKQAVYQVDAAREAATQAAVKTANDDVNYRRNAMDYIFDSDVKSASVEGLTGKKIRFVSAGDVYNRYYQEYRKNQFNQWLRNGLLNEYDFGGSATSRGTAVQTDWGLTPYYQSRNLLNGLKFKLSNEIGNMGTYGKLFISLLDLLK